MGYIKPWLTVIGLLFEFIGVLMVASEVVRKYQGKKFSIEDHVIGDIMGCPVDQDDIETDNYKYWQVWNLRYMKAGLLFISLGFILQIIGNWP